MKRLWQQLFCLLMSTAFCALSAAEPVIRFQVDETEPSPVEKLSLNIGKVYFFEGVNKQTCFVAKSPREIGSSYTISAWIQPEGLPGTIKTYCILGVPSIEAKLCYAPSGRFSFETVLLDGKKGSTWSRPFRTDNWYHLVVCCDSQKGILKFYANGELQHYSRISTAKDLGNVFQIGCYDPTKDLSGRFNFNGLMKELEIYDSALSDAEIKDLYRKNAGKYNTLPAAELLSTGDGMQQLSQPLPAFASNAVPAARLAKFRKEAPGKIDEAEKSLKAMKAQLRIAFQGIDCLQKERTAARMEIAENLISFLRRNYDQENDGVFYAYLALDDIKEFITYFEREIELWEMYPRSKTAEDPGNNPTIFQFNDFGAVNDGKTDNSAAWQKALDAIRAQKGNPCILNIAPGEYLFENPAIHPEANIPVVELKNAIIQGESPDTTTFIAGVYKKRNFVLDRCLNVAVKNLSLRTKEIPFCQGEIVDLDVPNAIVTIQHDPRTIPPTEEKLTANPSWQCATAYAKDGSMHRTQSLSWNHGKVENLGSGKYRIQMDKRNSLAHLRKGYQLVIPNRVNGASGFSSRDSEFCIGEKIYVRTSYAAAFGFGCYGSLKDCKVIPYPGFVLSSNADAYIGLGAVYIDGLEVKNPGDDCFNTYTPTALLGMVSGNQANPGRMHGWKRNGVLRPFMSITTGQYLFLNRITDKADQWASIFEDDFPSDIRSSTDNRRKYRDVAGGTRNMVIYNSLRDITGDPRSMGVGVVIRNSSFSNARSGVVFQMPNSMMDNCTFANICHGVSFRVGCHVLEGIPPYNITFKNNKSQNSFAGFISLRFAGNLKSASCAPIHGVTFENNEIKDTAFCIWAQNLSDAVFRNNKFSGATGINAFGEQSCRFLFDLCQDITLEGNTLNGKPVTEKTVEIRRCRNIFVR